MNKTILITGANGQLGSELREISESYDSFNFQFIDLQDLDITDTVETVRFIAETKPGWVVNCAGYTAVDRAESEQELASMVNGDSLSGITDGLLQYGGKLIHISTDFVFSGKSGRPYMEEDIPDPISVYGKSKLRGEEIALSYPGSIVLRTSWLYSVFGNNFVKTIIRLASERDTINVVSDQVGNPTYARDLADVIMKIIVSADKDNGTFYNGIYNYSNEGSCSWYEFAMEIKKIAGLKITINPVSTEQYPLPAKRPAMSVLDKSKIKHVYGITIPGWKNSLHSCIKKLNK